MIRTYGWHAARLAVLLLLIVGVRVGMGLFVHQAVAGATNGASVEMTDEGSVDLDALAQQNSGGAGDPGRAGQEIHEDLVADGQVVMRDGELVVLIESDVPGEEKYVPLNPRSPDKVPWLLREGWGPTVAAVFGGGTIYLIGWAFILLVLRPKARST